MTADAASVAACCSTCEQGGDPIAGHCVDIDGFYWHDCPRTAPRPSAPSGDPR